jgi:hypothetical protein
MNDTMMQLTRKQLLAIFACHHDKRHIDMEKHGKRQFYRRHLRMKPKSFEKLLSYIKDDIQPDERMAAMRGGATDSSLLYYNDS